MRFYDAIKRVYPDIKLITNCDASSRKLNHPADYYDFHVKVLTSCLVLPIKCFI